MKEYTVTLLPDGKKVQVQPGTTLLEAMRLADIVPDAPCGGRGTCGKCKVELEKDGARTEVLACQTKVESDLTVHTGSVRRHEILTAGGTQAVVHVDGACDYCVAIDIGTTTLVAYLLDGRTGAVLATSSMLNPQREYGADVISRIQYSLNNSMDPLTNDVRAALNRLIADACGKAGITPERIELACVVGNTCMHHLFLSIDPHPLVIPPYMPNVTHSIEQKAAGILDIAPDGMLRVLPNIAGFVGADTVGCMLAADFGNLEPLTLLIDIGTNGEMVLGNKTRRIACSTAAGPAFEGAKISCGMRGAEGAIDHVFMKDGKLSFSVIGGGTPVGICGSGLLDIVSVCLEEGIIQKNGRIVKPDDPMAQKASIGRFNNLACIFFKEAGEDSVYLSQRDIRELQLAKAAIAAGIDLMMKQLGIGTQDVVQVLLAGAFGNYMNPHSACGIEMIPPELESRIRPIGNAAGEGAKLAVLSADAFRSSQRLAEQTEFLELASLPEFQDCYVDHLGFGEDER